MDENIFGSGFFSVVTDLLKKEARNDPNVPDSFVMTDTPSIPKRMIRHVSSVDDIKQAISDAVREKKVIRAVGSEHSVKESIYPDGDGITIRLEGDLRKLTQKEIMKGGKKYLRVRVGAGCNIGVDPDDPGSNVSNSLAKQINDLGYALPITGGIIYQTVGGFMQTGSAGGSLQHGFEDVIQTIEFVNGRREVVIAEPDQPIWCAVGVSMGLLGIITHVTFDLPETFYVEGTQINKKFEDSDIGFDENGKSRLPATLKSKEYFRANWFPQQGVNKVAEWSGHQVATNGPIEPYNDPLSSPLVALGAGLTLYATSCLLQKPKLSEFDLWMIKVLLNKFEPDGAKQTFRDYWFKILPQDNTVPTDTLLPVEFTEIWLPMDKCDEVMKSLQKMFKDPKAAGNFATEIYAAKASPFWLSMSYGGPYVRIDAFWYAHNCGNIREFYEHFWRTLLIYDKSRLHWGKYMPLPGEKVSDKVTFNLEYMKAAYPEMNEWLKKRQYHDPHNIFLNNYWREYFEIKD